MGGVGAPLVVLLEMGERGEYSCREGSGVSWKDAFHGFITPVWEIVSKMGGCPVVLHINLGALKFFRISAREAMKLREDSVCRGVSRLLLGK